VPQRAVTHSLRLSEVEAACLLAGAHQGQIITILCDLDAVYPSARKKYNVRFVMSKDGTRMRFRFGAGWAAFARAHDLRAGDALFLERVKDRVDTQGKPRPTLAARVIFGPDTAPKGSFSITTTTKHKSDITLHLRAMTALFPDVDYDAASIDVTVVMPASPDNARRSWPCKLSPKRIEGGGASTGGCLDSGWKGLAKDINLKAGQILTLTRVAGEGAPELEMRLEAKR
jgi:hypothetical protein